MSYFEIPENPEFNSQMKKLESTDPAHAELFNSMFEQLLINVVAIVLGTIQTGNAKLLDGNDSSFFAKTTDITAIVNGTTKAGNADKLDGNDSIYFAKASDITAITSGTMKVGNATLLDGNASSYYAKATALASYLPLTGGNITGNLTIGSKQVFHAGNSKPIVVSSTAPTDTTSIWIQ